MTYGHSDTFLVLCVIRFVFSPASAYVLAELLLPPL